MINHEWKLVAPWYRWQRQFAAEQRKPWQTRPVFQKFDQTDFARTFTQDPQHSLTFIDSEDTVFNTSLKDVPALSAGPLAPRSFMRLYAPRKVGGGKASGAQEATLVPTGVRKLYLATHKRHYLVVSELHCFAPGFPTVKPAQACQAGFVVRRRTLNIPAASQKEARKQAEQILKEINAVAADIAFWEQTSPSIGFRARRRALEVQKAKTNGTYDDKLKVLKVALSLAQKKLVDWRATFKVTSTLEGWVPGAFEHIGSWEQVEEAPKQTSKEPFPRNEAYFPLFPVFPDPKNLQHSATGKTIYFGVVPTSGLDTDQYGAARFDSDATYEIRCFVRRHKPDCPRLDKTPDCHGELIWSEPTEVFKLASATDLQGTANRPITIKMPDFAELAAQAASLPVSKLAPVRVEHPQSMNFNVEDGKASDGGVGGFQICFISIPLITIVAMFLLKLFLPIVVFLFGLFFLLQLKFCIPPSLSVSAGVFGKVDAVMPKLELDASLDIDVDLDAEFGAGFTLDLNQDLRDGITTENSITEQSKKDMLLDFSNTALFPVGVSMNEANKLRDENDRPKPEAGSDLVASLEFEPRVEVIGK